MCRKYLLFACAIGWFSVWGQTGEIAGNSLKWKLTQYAKIEGNVLTVDIPKDAPHRIGNATAIVPLDKIDGRHFIASVKCKGENVSKPIQRWNGLKMQFEYENPTTGEKEYPNTRSRLGSFPETEIETHVVDAGGTLKSVRLVLGLQDSTGKVTFDLSTLRIRSGCEMFPITNSNYRVSYPDRVLRRPQLKGVMLPARDCTEDDFKTMKEWGVTLARYQMIRNWSAVNADRSIPEYLKWLNGRLDHLDRQVLPWAEKYGIMIVVDVHVAPGGRNEDLNMFHEMEYNDAFVNAWRDIAKRFKGRKMIYGYDLINEPQQTQVAACDYWNTQRKAAEAVREIDPEVTIIMESNGWDSPVTFGYLSPLAMDNVIYQVHMYLPFEFTHQGVHGQKTGAVYPDPKKGWNRENLKQRLRYVREFQQKHNAKIYVGEFSAIVWAQGAEKYLEDCISIFKEYGWDWTYHAFREWNGWSVEHTSDEKHNFVPSADNPRKRALIKGFQEKSETLSDILEVKRPETWEGIRIYRDLAYGPRKDAPGEGKAYQSEATKRFPDGRVCHSHRTGQLYDLIVDENGFEPDSPLYIHLHGGAWCQPFDKDGESMWYLRSLAKKGFVVVNADYIMQTDVLDGKRKLQPTPGANYLSMLRDIDCLVTHIKNELIPALGLKARKIAIGGGSAGAYLSTLYAYDQANPEWLKAGLTHDLPIGFVVDVVGPTDLASEDFTKPILRHDFSDMGMFNEWSADRLLTLFCWLTEDDLRGRLAKGDIDGARKTLIHFSPNRMVNAATPPTILAYCRIWPWSKSDGCVPTSTYYDLMATLEKHNVPHVGDLRSWRLHGWLRSNFEDWVTDNAVDYAKKYL